MIFNINATLLASIFLLVALSDALPTKRNTGLLTMPLKRITRNSADIHPLVALQQHINRGDQRLARMTGRNGPTHEQCKESINKRMYIPEKPSSAVGQQRKRADGPLSGLNGKPAASVAVTASAAATPPAATPPAAPPAAPGNNSTAQGFPVVDLQGAINGGLTVAKTPTTANSLGLDIVANDVGYVATFQIGTPPKNFNLLMDSGSADFWVAATDCASLETGQPCSKLHQSLGTSSSSSFVDSGAPFNVTYGAGKVSGTIIKDNVVIANLSLPGHVFGASSEESKEFSGDDIAFDGLVGLAKSTISNQGVPTPVESLASAGLISDAITSYKISRLADGLNDGEITFGGLDQTKFNTNSLVTVKNVNALGFWETGLDAVTVNGQDLGLKKRTTILDTGTTLMIVPAKDAAAIHAAIPGSQSDGQGGFTIPCTTTASVALTIGAKSFAIDPRDLTFLPEDPNNLTGNCVSGISSGSVGGANEWLVGDVFLKNVYFSHDVGKNTISLASLV
ncbi:hypothetical protein BOTBODRAFT_32830 [Botryobasidium botryosum FD-172 SS1]|uniref:Peptidase A1 domain-containing protein n=1 Tax=Botryobasidium botryosum (strain FD-172 SS1) TaxID=930990 RepID=A0A067MS43_BOTB1|nr:hypothetical protein BOTBODRAFT_32830 [Botryobasidium botryosum FD-172 SS1]